MLGLVAGRPGAGVHRYVQRPCDQRAVPAADRLRPHEQALPAIPWKQLSERAEQDSVDRAQARSTDLTAKNRELMSQNDDRDSVFGSDRQPTTSSSTRRRTTQ
jgi:hypothetical protein